MNAVCKILFIAVLTVTSRALGAPQAGSGDVYFRKHLKCVLDNLDSYRKWGESLPGVSLPIPLKICPYTDPTSEEARKIAQRNELPDVSKFPNVQIRFILIIKKSELDCLSLYRSLLDSEAETTSLPTPLCPH